MEIRVATAADAERIARVKVAAWRASYGGLVSAEVLAGLSVAIAAGSWATRIATPGVRVWVAGPPGEVAAFAGAGPTRDPGGTGGEVYALYVHPDRQRAGTGRRLLAAATAWLAGQGYAEASLWVLSGNAGARACYERCGWAWDGTEQEVRVGGDLVPEVRYRMALRHMP